MNTATLQRIATTGMAALLTAMVLIGCSSPGVTPPVIDSAHRLKQGPQEKPFRSITSFSSALRCMDDLMISNGVRDVSVLVEDLIDQTKKVNAGTKDMLISAVSDMTKRSRAIRLIAYGQDSGNLIGFLAAAERKNAYAIVPQYDIKGSISQFDDNIAKKSVELGLAHGENFNLGYGRSGAATILGIDLTILNTGDLSVVWGVTSRNAVLIYKSGKGLDGEGNPALAQAVVDQRAALGLSSEVKADLPLVTALLTGKTGDVPASGALAVARPSPQVPAALSITSTGGGRKPQRGELLNLAIRADQNVYVYCFMHDEHDQVQRFFPNRFAQDALVQAGKPLQLPGAMRFQLVASESGNSESVGCFAVPTDVYASLPAAARGTDFEPLPARSLEQVQQAFAAVAGPSLAEAYYRIDVSK